MLEQASNKNVFLRLSLHIVPFLFLFLLPVFALAQEKSPHQTLGSSACEKCHKTQNEWWPKNSHYQTAEAFFDQKAKQVKIARLYGINPADMTKGNAVCMRCHATIVSGSEKDVVTDGVGCEACHGPAKDYLKPHQEGDKALGENRPGRIKGLELGMLNLRDLKVRAKNCGRCHNITEAKLISAGHPSSTNSFDYFVDGMAKIRHWSRPLDASDALAKAHREVSPAAGQQAVAKEPPQQPQQTLPTTSPTAAAGTASPATVATPPAVVVPPAVAAPSPVRNAAVLPLPVRPPPPPVPRPVQPIPVQQSLPPEEEDVPLPPLPKISKNTSVEEILLIVKERLDLLQRAVHKEP